MSFSSRAEFNFILSTHYRKDEVQTRRSTSKEILISICFSPNINDFKLDKFTPFLPFHTLIVLTIHYTSHNQSLKHPSPVFNAWQTTFHFALPNLPPSSSSPKPKPKPKSQPAPSHTRLPSSPQPKYQIHEQQHFVPEACNHLEGKESEPHPRERRS